MWLFLGAIEVGCVIYSDCLLDGGDAYAAAGWCCGLQAASNRRVRGAGLLCCPDGIKNARLVVGHQ